MFIYTIYIHIHKQAKDRVYYIIDIIDIQMELTNTFTFMYKDLT